MSLRQHDQDSVNHTRASHDIDLETLLSVSLTLDERIRAHDNSTIGSSVPAASREIGNRRVAAWRERLVIDGKDFFGQRLDRDRLLLSRATAICSHQRFSVLDEPPWLDPFLGGLHLWGEAQAPPLQEVVPFSDLLWPFCESASQRMCALLPKGLWADLPSEVRISAQTYLLARLAKACQWCLYQRFEAFRPNVTLDTYARFLDIARSTAWAHAFFTEFAGLARPIGTCVAQWLDMMTELLERWQSDAPRLRQLVGAPPDSQLARFDSFPSDPHRHGRSVVIVRLTSGHRVVYKPVDGALSLLWERAALKTFGAAFSRSAVLLGDGYSWHTYIEPRAPDTGLEKETDLIILGRLLALATALGSSDIHFENLVLHACGPQLIDHETVLSPGFRPGRGRTSRAERRAMLILARSVLTTGALPQWLSGPSGSVWNVNVVGWEEKGPAPALFPRIADANTDQMRVTRELGPNSRRPSVPTQEVSRFGAALAAAFADGRKAVIKARAELDALINECSGASARVVLRDTRFYGELLGHGFMPAYCHDVLDRSLLFERLYRPLLASGAQSREWDLCHDEHQALIRFDIPYFETPVDELAISEVNGRASRIRPNGAAPLRHARESLRAMTSREGENNSQLVTAAFESSAWPEVAIHAVDLPPRAKGASREQWRSRQELARDLFKSLRKALFSSSVDHSVALIGASLHGVGQTQQLGLCTSSDSYSGVAGIGLLAAALCHGEVASSSRTTAEAVAHTLMLAGERLRSEPLRNASDGAFAGATGVAFALAKIGELLDEVAYVEAAGSLLGSLDPANARAEPNLDVISGVAGRTLVATALHLKYPLIRPAMRPFLDECRELLLSAAIATGEDPPTLSWPSMGVPDGVSGFAHGAAGISAALARLQIAGTGPTGDAVEAGLRREGELYDPAAQGWPTIQGPTQTQHPVGNAWCYGGPGIMLAAVEAIAADIAVEPLLIERARSNMLASRPAADGLCHGLSGIALVALRAAEVLGDAALRRWAVDRLDEIAAGRFSAHLRLEPVSQLRYAGGLMCGASGVALALLAPELGPVVANMLAIA